MSGCLGSDDGSMYGSWVGMGRMMARCMDHRLVCKRGYLCKCDNKIRL